MKNVKRIILAAALAIALGTTTLVGRPQIPPMSDPDPPAPLTHFTNQTLRQIVRATLGGSPVRVVLSNAFSTEPFTIGAAHIALRDKEDAIQAQGGQMLTFSGLPTVTIPAMGIVRSDPVTLPVPPLSDLAIDLYLPGTTNVSSPLTLHTSSFQTTYVSGTGNHAGAAKFPTVATVRSWLLLARIEVDVADLDFDKADALDLRLFR
jgi:hypothetical protein